MAGPRPPSCPAQIDERLHISETPTRCSRDAARHDDRRARRRPSWNFPFDVILQSGSGLGQSCLRPAGRRNTGRCESSVATGRHRKIGTCSIEVKVTGGLQANTQALSCCRPASLFVADDVEPLLARTTPHCGIGSLRTGTDCSAAWSIGDEARKPFRRPTPAPEKASEGREI